MERADDRHRVPVLVVGAGPAGLMAAAALARLGVRSLVVERRAELPSLPRATIVGLRGMELLRGWGLEAAVRAGGVDVEMRMWETATLTRLAEGGPVLTGLPNADQSALVSPTAPACVPQDHLEPVLLDHLRALGRTEVLRGAEVVEVQAGTGGVRAALADGRVVHARYVVAADGARSTVRAQLGLAMRGPGDLGAAVSAQLRAPLWELVGDVRALLYITNAPGGEGLFLPAGPTDRWVFGRQAGHGEAPLEQDAADLADRIRAAAGVPSLPVHIERLGHFDFAAQLAERFATERAFLVGDAAHRVTPRGGTGLNMALQDGFDVGWKLGWVLRGWAPPALLASYEAERRPVAEHNARRSADPRGSRRHAADELHADLAGRLPHAWVGDGVSTLDLLGPGLTLLAGPGGPAWEAAARTLAGRVPLRVRRVGELAARAVGVRGAGALLVRPDAAPVALLASPAGLRDAVRRAVTGAAGEEAPPVGAAA